MLDENFLPFPDCGITGKQFLQSQEFSQVGGAGSFFSNFLLSSTHPPYSCVPYAVEADPKKYNIKFIILS